MMNWICVPSGVITERLLRFLLEVWAFITLVAVEELIKKVTLRSHITFELFHFLNTFIPLRALGSCCTSEWILACSTGREWVFDNDMSLVSRLLSCRRYLRIHQAAPTLAVATLSWWDYIRLVLSRTLTPLPPRSWSFLNCLFDLLLILLLFLEVHESASISGFKEIKIV